LGKRDAAMEWWSGGVVERGQPNRVSRNLGNGAPRLVPAPVKNGQLVTDLQPQNAKRVVSFTGSEYRLLEIR
jgi:hypothetical protein